MERLNRDREKQYENSQAHLERNLEEIALLGQRLDEALAQKDHLNAELIRLRKESLEATNLWIELLRSERVMLCESLCRSSLYVKFHTSGARITAEDWMSLRAELDRIYDLTSRLYEICPQISDMELRICYLIKIQVKVRDMASILNRSVSGVSSVRGRLYTKITGEIAPCRVSRPCVAASIPRSRARVILPINWTSLSLIYSLFYMNT